MNLDFIMNTIEAVAGDRARIYAGKIHNYLTGSEKYYQHVEERVSDATLRNMEMIWGIS
jgi:hypothetical protein